MVDHSFSKPVSIFVGMGFPLEVRSVLEARQVLDEWSGSRSPAYAAAFAACQSALVGEQDVEAVRVSFEAFARSRGILAPDAMELAAARMAEDWLTA
ncbi:MAG: DUF982 domain-containing protein [Mesorhizobium sp.]|uniref:DUF982 domain-containing protein n=1 Tax=Mesorhizobium sp. TaxID=1871066 RepID=UPI000FE7E9C2|nr:DUF982 domain-containing protein [Mesorhizobium sp.]RWD50010.1 MAG: DUF982 domain-containing protein [Mesorhizobium sp.]RWE46902.1 MAG: DUF982 domain-containing protein [Mesorhizobium sp.]